MRYAMFFLVLPLAWAGPVLSVQANDNACNQAASAAQGRASIVCIASESTAEYDAPFNGYVTTYSQIPFGPSYDAGGSASIIDTESTNYIVSGGSGAGMLTMDFSIFSEGSYSDGSSAGFAFSTNYGSYTAPKLDGACPVECWEDNAVLALQVPFVYGQQFTLDESYDLSASSVNLYGDQAGANAQAIVSLAGFAVAGNADAVLTDPVDAPEPETWLLALLACAFLLGFSIRGIIGDRRKK